MFTDLSGFSRQVATFGIIHFLEIIQRQNELLFPILQAHDGILIKSEADSLLCIFRRANRALACAEAMMTACARVNRDLSPERQILLCLGLGFGRVLRVGDADVFGQEVNSASKLGEDVAKAYEILMTPDFAAAAELPKDHCIALLNPPTVCPGSLRLHRPVT